MRNKDDERLMTVEDVAAFLRKRPKTMYQPPLRDQLPWKTVAHSLRMLRSDLLAWVAKQTRHRTGPPVNIKGKRTKTRTPALRRAA